MSTAYAKITDPKVAEQTIAKVSRAYRAASGKVRTLTADAAYATEAGYASGLIGKPSDGAEMTALAYGERFGVASATVTLWRRLGRALIVGVSTDSEMWQTLAFKAAANDKPVADAIMADGATVAKIATALESTRLPDGKRKPKVGGTDGKPNDGTDAATPAVPAEVTDPAERVKIVLGILDAEVKAAKFDAEGWAKVESALNKIISREVTLLAKAAKAADAA